MEQIVALLMELLDWLGLNATPETDKQKSRQKTLFVIGWFLVLFVVAFLFWYTLTNA